MSLAQVMMSSCSASGNVVDSWDGAGVAGCGCVEIYVTHLVASWGGAGANGVDLLDAEIEAILSAYLVFPVRVSFPR